MRTLALFAMTALGVLGTASTAAAEPTLAGDVKDQPAIGFSNLVIRVDNDPEIGIAGEEARIHIIEALRESGLNAVGAESLVFGKDHAERADFLLGGTVRELKCVAKDKLRCGIGVEWQLLDVRRDGVVYSALTRFMTIGGSRRDPKVVGKALIMGALKRLTVRPKFRAAMAKGREDLKAETRVYDKVAFRQCDEPALEMPKEAEQALDATVVIRSGDAYGSGFVISPDGFILTAAHVVSDPDIAVRMRDGTNRKARLVRIAKNVDSALLKLSGGGTISCLAIDVGAKNVGDETYAIGSPASEKLAFSLTRGIISGVRNFDGKDFLQTDASVSPGNSGGPLINKQGRATAVVSWKISGASVQGIAFGIPIEASLRGLGLAPASATDPGLNQESAAPEKAGRIKPDVDVPDEPVVLDPMGDAERDEAKRVAERDAKTPGGVRAMRWGGLTLGIVGPILVVHSANAYSYQTTTHPDYRALRLENDLGWVAAVAGWGMFITSYAIAPRLAPAKAAGATSSIGVGIGPGHVVLAGSF